MTNPNLTRRQILKGAVACSSTVLPGMLRAQDVAAAPIRLALIGCGGRGTGAVNQALNAHPGVMLTCVADIAEDRITNTLKLLGDRHADRIDCPRERQFVGLDAYKPAINKADAVILAAPTGFRPAHFEFCVDQGKHVFLEKNLAVDAPGVRRLLAANQNAKAKGLICVAGYNRRFDEGLVEAVGRIHSGEIGEIRHMDASWLASGIWT